MHTEREIIFYGLLHLEKNQSSAMNVLVKSFEEQITIYLKNAISLSNSLKLNKINFILLTNEKELIEKIYPSTKENLNIENIPFKTKVPDGTRFYSAHYKLDAFKYLASQNHAYVGLLDLDMLCLKKIPISLENIIKNKTPLCYDITDQEFPAYGEKPVIDDLSRINRLVSEGRWCGGEFISGPPEFFSLLTKKIDEIYSNYIASLTVAHHIGDEAFTSAAIEIIRKEGIYIGDAGSLGIVGRYWNTKTLHPQKSFNYFKDSFLIHLPADKIFLSKIADIPKEKFNIENIMKSYRKKIKLMKIKILLQSLLK